MQGKCLATGYTKTFSKATATERGVLGIEYANAYCPHCETHHQFAI